MIKKIVLALIICVVVALGVGFAISGDYEVTRSTTINATPDKIYPHIADLKEWPKWTAWNTTNYPKMTTEYSGADSGVGAKSAWSDPENGDGNMEITAAEADELVEWNLDFAGFPGSTGFAKLTGVEKQVTRVTYSMKGNMGSNPLMKLMGLNMDSMMGSEFDESLAGLKKLVEEGDGAAPDAAKPEEDTKRGKGKGKAGRRRRPRNGKAGETKGGEDKAGDDGEDQKADDSDTTDDEKSNDEKSGDEKSDDNKSAG